MAILGGGLTPWHWSTMVEYDTSPHRWFQIERVKENKVEVVDMSNMSPEEAKKHIFGAINFKEEETEEEKKIKYKEKLTEEEKKIKFKEKLTYVFDKNEETRLEKLRKHIAEAANVPYNLIFGKEEK